MTQSRMAENLGFSIVADYQSSLGEGISFNLFARKLAWVDITGNSIFIQDLGSSFHRRIGNFIMPSCTFSGESHGVYVSHLGGIDFIDYRTSGYYNCATWFDKDSGIRCNDGTMDLNGNIWISTMAIDHSENQGAIWFWDKKSKPQLVIDNLTIPNALAVDTKRNRLYFGDSANGNIYRSDLPSKIERNIHSLVFQNSPKGVPDGSYLDCDGFLWNARWEGSAIIKISPEGVIVRELELPISRPTSCVIIEAYQEIYITSAKVVNEPLSGYTIKSRL